MLQRNKSESAFLLIKSYFPMWKLRAVRMPAAAEINDADLFPLHASRSRIMRFHASAPLQAAVFAGLFGLLGTAAHAFEDSARGIYVEGGRAPHGEMGSTNSATVGMTFPWSPRQPVQEGALTTYWDVFLSNWHAPALGNGPHDYAQIGAIYTWRYRFDHGSSPWFAEGGVGGSVMDHVYKTPDRSFSTAFQFTEVLGVGRSFGEHGEHELSLRLQHFSNGGIKKPNPGENFVKLRYTYHF
jgi:lipid A 3-O-deacylase